jgi:indole-3-glycerol phosphate synthase
MIERLREFYEASEAETEARRKHISDEQLYEQVSKYSFLPKTLGFEEAIVSGDVGVIAEFKQSSPSAGEINQSWSVADTAREYQSGGAVAMSVLTINHKFSGSMEFLEDARFASDLPLLRKDFISNKRQVLEAAGRGAKAILLIVGGFDDQGLLRELDGYAKNLGLDRLIEVHNERELDLGLDLNPGIIGINNRDLTHPDMPTDTNTFKKLAPLVPLGILKVAESGYEVDIETKEKLREQEADAVLVGSSLMKHDNPQQALKNWNNS